MKKLLSIVLVVAVLGGFAWLISYIGKNTPQAPADSGQHILVGSTTSDGNFVYYEETATYTVELKYPAATLLTDRAADQKARLAIEAALKTTADEFKQNVAGLDASVMPSLESRKLALAADYKQYQSTSTISYFYTVYEDTGGAHPNGYFKTFVFDEQGSEVKLGALLSKNPNWLEELSLVVSEDVVAQYKVRAGVEDATGLIYPEGLAPKEENFQNFYVDGDRLVIEIPPYQVAAYAAGSFEVSLSLTDMNK